MGWQLIGVLGFIGALEWRLAGVPGWQFTGMFIVAYAHCAGRFRHKSKKRED